MIHSLERELFLRELKFLKALKGKVLEDDYFSAAIEDEIELLEEVIEETETKVYE